MMVFIIPFKQDISIFIKNIVYQGVYTLLSLILTFLAPIILSVWVLNFMIHWFGIKRIPRLPIVKDQFRDEPLISIIIAAKNEEQTIEQTVRTLLQQAYSGIQLIVVNDRSTDRTGQVLEELASSLKDQISFQVVHIQDLPEGWLGKNHALQTGFEYAKGSYILFTDADVRYHPYTIRSSVSFMKQHHVDHLTLAPYMRAEGFWLHGFVHYFMFSLSMVKWPWVPNNDKQRKSGYGIGAFNLLSREAYLRIGKHETISMRPDDDLQLGTKIKQAGLKQRFLMGREVLEVEWYPSLREAMIGLEKNMFAGLHYSVLLFIAAISGKLIFYFLPFVAILFTKGWTFYAYALSSCLMIVLYLRYTRTMSRDKGTEVIVLPLLVLLFVYVTVRSCFLILKKGGMNWRGTFYTLEQLKKHK